MTTPILSVGFLAVVGFSLVTVLEPWFQSWAGSRTQSANVLQIALGDGRRLFARHVYLKADAYFHNGFYPSIYDDRGGYEDAHIAESVHSDGDADEELKENFLGKPKDWIDRFSRHFYPTRHTHLGDSGCGHSCCQRPKGHAEGECEHDHEHHAEAADGLEREILPWLRLSAELDPQRVEIYVVSAYWLRTALNKPDEAEAFLREGLRANPSHCELLFELGRIYRENGKDLARARNVWELALADWPKRQTTREEPNLLLREQLLGNLARVEEELGNYPKAVEHLKALLALTTSPGRQEPLKKWLADLDTKAAKR
jgi:tetratricopeptide (TPR) repeat protein